MKSKEFLAALRLIIREEVTKSVRKELQNVLTEQRSPVQQQMPRTAPVQSRPKPKPKAPLFKDPMLNELLSSVGPIQQESAYNPVGYEEWPTMQYGDDPRMPMFGNMQMQSGPINAAPDGTSIEAIEQIAPEVASALTRDYRSLMKAINAKKGK